MDSGHHSRNGFLTRRGYETVKGPEVDKTEVKLYLDSRVSVSGLRRDETLSLTAELLEEQCRRFLNGC